MFTPVSSDTSFPLTSTFGVALAGSWVGVCLYGLTIAQAYIYFQKYPKDSWQTKSLVGSLWALNTLHTIFVCLLCYHYMITALLHMDVSMLLVNVWSLSMLLFLRCVVSAIVMFYYIKTIIQLNGEKMRWWVIGIVMVPIVCYFAFAIDTILHAYWTSIFTEVFGFAYVSILPCLVMQVISDGFITVSLCIILFKKRTEFKGTRKIVNALILFTTTRGLVTLLAALTMVILLMIRPDQMWYIGPEITMVGLYTNSLMAFFNTRSSSCDTKTVSPTVNMSGKTPYLSSRGERHQKDTYI
ncbi:hypothetical protein SERLADRAFT_479104, partial [Serpula lacrymans var. lacrymans S7.9]